MCLILRNHSPGACIKLKKHTTETVTDIFYPGLDPPAPSPDHTAEKLWILCVTLSWTLYYNLIRRQFSNGATLSLIPESNACPPCWCPEPWGDFVTDTIFLHCRDCLSGRWVVFGRGNVTLLSQPATSGCVHIHTSFSSFACVFFFFYLLILPFLSCSWGLRRLCAFALGSWSFWFLSMFKRESALCGLFLCTQNSWDQFAWFALPLLSSFYFFYTSTKEIYPTHYKQQDTETI